jgi:RNA polymerase sigma factor (sigma-70 family)
LKAGKECEGVGRDRTVVGELGPSDQQDLELCRAVGGAEWERGGSEAFWTLWEKHREWIWLSVRGASRRVCPWNVDRGVFAEALLERVLLRLTQRAHRYQGRAPFRAFLKKVIVNASIDQWRYYDARRESAGPERPLDAADSDPEDDGPAAPGPAYRTKTFPSPERLALAKERAQILYAALRLLVTDSAASVNQAAALRLFYLEDRIGAEIARELGCSVAAVHKYLERGRKELKSVLEKRFGIEKIEDLIA